MTSLSCIALVSGLALAVSVNTSKQDSQPNEEKPMQLGNFSVSLAVKDIETSRAFYEKLDFKQVGGEPEQKWLILQNGSTTIGLFQGMFDNNIMTFNPGWDKDQNTLEDFHDIRELQSTLRERGIVPLTEADEKTNGPTSFVLVDPDGNTIFFDQHVDSPN